MLKVLTITTVMLLALSSAAEARQHHRRYVSFLSTGETVAHPAGCPSRAFCGCGVAVKVFGRAVRELWLAANWLRFPHSDPAPGMVAVRRHHVFYIISMVRPGVALAYDPNSGGHATRIHERSLAGYSIRNPHGTHFAQM